MRIEYNGGNRKPTSSPRSTRKPAGATPLRVALSSKGTNDPDADSLRYQWTITRPKGGGAHASPSPIRRSRFAQAGVYTASLAVTDAQGASSTESVQIVGRQRAAARWTSIVAGGNQTFFFPGYADQVRDARDRS